MLQHLQQSLSCRIEISIKKNQKKKQKRRIFFPVLIMLMEVVMVPPCFVIPFSWQSSCEWVVGVSGWERVMGGE